MQSLVNPKVLAIALLAIGFISLGGVKLLEPATKSLRETIDTLKGKVTDRVDERKADTQAKSTGDVKDSG